MKTPTALIIGLICLAIACCFLTRANQRLEQQLFAAQTYIQTPQELQQHLKDTNNPRYDPGQVDGIIDPNTLRAWDNWLNDKDADVYMKAAGFE